MKIQALGPLRLTGSRLTRPKPLLLLAYLAMEGRKPRSFLAELFFADARDPADALSTTLRRLGEARAGIEVSDGFLNCTFPCDASTLLTLLDAGNWERAIELYRRPFLEGFRSSVSPELEEWVYGTREYLAKRVRDSLLYSAEGALGRGELESAELLTSRAYSLGEAPDLEPGDLDRMYRLFSRLNAGRAAEVRAVASSYGIEIEEDSASDTAFLEHSAGNTLPALGARLIGRDLELLDIASTLTNGECRLLTVHGPGGVGKTRLAVQAAYEQLSESEFPDGVGYVPLEALTHPDQIPNAVATALALPPLSIGDPWSSLERQLSRSRLLLVLDNFEHLIASAPQLNGLLGACPDLTLLVTSRERLNLKEEWLLTLAGLPIPDNDAGLAEALTSDAVNLFVHRAKRVRLEFSLTDEDVPFVLRICRAVAGFPLGLELAAAWIRIVPLADLADTLEEKLAVLDTTVTDVSGRHRSLWNAFRHSWNLLSPKEQGLLRRLAVFRGGFRREAAAVVAGATLPDLIGLVDKSLLHVLPDGRFDQHALLAQFMREKLSEHPDEESLTLEKHGDYFTRLLVSTQAQTQGGAFPELFAVLAEEESNLLAYFDWAVANERSEALALLSEPLLWYFPQRGRFRDGIATFGRAIDALPVTRPETNRALSGLLTSQAWLCRLTGDIEATRTYASRAVELARQPGSESELVRALDLLAQAQFFSGQYSESLAPAREGLALERALTGDPVRVNRFLQSIAYAEGHLGDYESALVHVQEAWGLFEGGGMPKSVDTISTLICFGFTHICRGSWQEGRRSAAHGIRLSEESGYTGTVPLLMALLSHCLFELGKLHNDEGLIAEAKGVCEEGLPKAAVSGEHLSPLLMAATLGRVALLQGRATEAERLLLDAVEPAWRTGNWLSLFWVLPCLADLYLERGEYAKAATLGGLMLEHQACPHWAKGKAESLRTDLAFLLASEEVDAHYRSSANLSIDTIMSRVTGFESVDAGRS